VGNQTDDRVIKPSLIARYEDAKRVLTAAETFRDQPAVIVAHNLLPF
jgi:hypothetical protein